MLFLVSIVFIVLFVILMGRITDLSSRVNQLERMVRSLGESQPKSRKKKVQKIEVTEEIEEIEEEIPDIIPLVTRNESIVEERAKIDWEEFFTKRFFTILGVVSIVLAIGFFAMWAFAHGWIGPMGRIAIGVIVSLAFVVMGELLREKYPKQFVALTSVGIAGLIVTTFLARNVYEFLSPSMAFALYVIEVGTGLVLALRYQSRMLGNFAVIGGLVAPLLVNGDPNGIGLLSYLLILSVAGFIISLKQKWPEILVILFVGVSMFELVVLDKTSMAKATPWIFLAFVFGQHFLMGSGGIVRLIRANKSQPLKENWAEREVGEFLLLIGAILVANGFGYYVFDLHEWDHFGFFVLFQGFLWYGLSEYLRTKGLEVFRHIATTATFVAIVFATFYEVGTDQPVILGLLLMAESFLLTMAGRITDEKWYGYVGRLILLTVTPMMAFENYSAAGYGILVIALMGITAYQSFDMSTGPKKLLNGIAITVALLSFFRWNFGELADATRFSWELFVLPFVLAVGVAYSVIKIKKDLPYVLSLVILGVVFGHFLFRDFIIDRNFKDIDTSIVLGLSLVSGFAVLAVAFIEDKKKYLVSEKVREIAVYGILSLNTFAVLYWSYEVFRSPVTEVVWIIWGALLLGTGISNQWPRFRYFGIGMLLLTIAKLYLIDVWDWGMGERVIAFSVLGVGLLILSFWGQKHLKK